MSTVQSVACLFKSQPIFLLGFLVFLLIYCSFYSEYESFLGYTCYKYLLLCSSLFYSLWQSLNEQKFLISIQFRVSGFFFIVNSLVSHLRTFNQNPEDLFVLWFSREPEPIYVSQYTYIDLNEIYYEESTHGMMEAGKSRDLPSISQRTGKTDGNLMESKGLRTKKVDGVNSSLRAAEEEIRCPTAQAVRQGKEDELLLPLTFVLFRPPADQMIPTHFWEGCLSY